MPLDAIVITESEAILDTPYVVLADNIADAGVNILEPQMQIFGEEFVLSSGGMYSNGNGLVGAVPNWLLTAIRNEMTSPDGTDVHTMMQNLRDAIDALSLGVSQYITSTQLPGVLSQSAIVTGLKSEIDANQATIINLLATKVTPEYAQALVAEGIESKFGPDITAFIGSVASTYVDANSAIAKDVSLVSASLNGVSADISDVNEVTITHTSQLTALTADIVDITNTIIPALQSQIDGEVTSWYYSYAPAQNNEPWASWIATDVAAGNTVLQDSHTGDLFYDLSTEVAYRFSKSAGVFGWGIISDSIIIQALANAARAQDTADGKRTIYGGSTVPLASYLSGSATIYLQEGDIWIPSANVGAYVAGEVYRCINPSSIPTVWIAATRYTAYLEGWITGAYATTISGIQTSIDKKAEIFYQSTTPRTTYTNVPASTLYDSYVGDLWKDTSSGGGHKEYIYSKIANGSNFNYYWAETQVPDLIFDTIDGKAALYTTDALPTSYMKNDLLVVSGVPFSNGTTTFAIGVLLTATQDSASFVASHWVKKINDTEDLDAFVDIINPQVSALQTQIDGAISTYFQLSSAALPSVAWTTAALKNAHHGDLLYFTDTKAAFRYSAVSSNWVVADDMTSVLAKISDAQAAADGKATVYYKTTTEINAITALWTAQQKLDNVGDVWIDSATNVSKIWNAVGWVNVATVDSNTALAKLADLEEARDGVVDTFYVISAPASGMSYGDFWVDTDSWNGTKYLVYRYENLNGSSTAPLGWQLNTGETAVALGKAYRADVLAGTAQSTADGKVKTWYQISEPTGLVAGDVGDLWVDTDNGNLTKTWSGSAWVDVINAQGKQAYTWSATSSKLITSPDGSITGWSFGDGTNTKSYFQINATNFKISDGTTGYTPFSIVGSDILFNGKVSFANTTNRDASLLNNNLGWTDNTVANAAVILAGSALTLDIDNINPTFEDWSGSYPIGFGSWAAVTPIKETAIIKNGSNAVRITSAAGIDGGMSISTGLFKSTASMDYDYITVSMDVYLASGTFAGAGLLLDWNGYTNYRATIDLNLEYPSPTAGKWYSVTKTVKRPTITGGTFTSFGGYLMGHYGGLNGGISVANSVIYDKLTYRKATQQEIEAISALATANTASTNASTALTQLTNIASDNILSPSEKSTVIADKAVIDTEKAGIDTQATLYAITTEKTAYDTAITSLTTYLATLTAPVAWNVITGDTTIVGTTFRTKFNDVYKTRQTLLNAISAKAKSLVDTAQSTASTAQTTANSKLDSSADLASLINANTTTINGGKITTGSITAGQIAANTITSSQLTTGIALINGEVKSSDFTTIGGAGFRLKSNAAGTSADPTIYGAYIRGGTIDSSTMDVRKLKVINTLGYVVAPVFIAHSSVHPLSTGIYINTGILSAADTSISTHKLVDNAGTTVSVINNNVTDKFTIWGNGTNRVKYVHVYVGESLAGSYYLPLADWTARSLSFSIAGFNFIDISDTDGGEWIYMLNDNVLVSNYTGEFKIYLEYWSTYPFAYSGSIIPKFLVSNI